MSSWVYAPASDTKPRGRLVRPRSHFQPAARLIQAALAFASGLSTAVTARMLVASFALASLTVRRPWTPRLAVLAAAGARVEQAFRLRGASPVAQGDDRSQALVASDTLIADRGGASRSWSRRPDLVSQGSKAAGSEQREGRRLLPGRRPRLARRRRAPHGQYQAVQENAEAVRRHMDPEERGTVDLEQIADQMFAIHTQLATLNRTIITASKR